MAKTPKYHLHHGAAGAAITVHVIQPAVENGIARVAEDGTIHVRLAYSGPSSECNQELLAYLAGVLRVPVKQMEIVGGVSGPDKLITILNVDTNTVQERILAAM